MHEATTHRAVEAVFRIEFPKLVAGLTRLVRDVGLAEELCQDALVAALEQWPREGVPNSPGAWLLGSARHRGIDRIRHERRAAEKHALLGHSLDLEAPVDLDARLDDTIGDDLLRLVFVACHPLLSREAQVAMTLRLVGSLTTEEIARAFLVSEATVAQRIVRAQRTLREAAVPFEVPRGADFDARLPSVLAVVYLIFNEGYAATEGDDWMRPALCEDAQRLGRVVSGLVPEVAEVHGLVALMELQASRFGARLTPTGEPILLLAQDRTRWNRLLLQRGLTALARAESLSQQPGPYTLQAAIAACHARALRAEDTDWRRIAALYETLAEVTPSPVVELNRAMALAMAYGPLAGLQHLEPLTALAAMQRYPLLFAARADLLARLGRHAEAADAFQHAASLTRNARERAVFEARAKGCAVASATTRVVL